MATKNFIKSTEAFDRAVAISDRVAMQKGYDEPVTDQMRLEVTTAWSATIEAFDVVARDVGAAIARASALIGADSGTLAQQVDAIKKRIEDANKKDYNARLAAADAQFQGRA